MRIPPSNNSSPCNCTESEFSDLRIAQCFSETLQRVELPKRTGSTVIILGFQVSHSPLPFLIDLLKKSPTCNNNLTLISAPCMCLLLLHSLSHKTRSTRVAA